MRTSSIPATPLCLLDPADTSEHAPARDGNHHHAGGRAPRAPRLLTSSPSACRSSTSSSDASRPGANPEPQRPRAEAADRPRRHLQDEHPLFVDAAFGVDGPVLQAQRASGRGDRPRDGLHDCPAARRRASRRSFPRRTDRRADPACRRWPASAARRRRGCLRSLSRARARTIRSGCSRARRRALRQRPATTAAGARDPRPRRSRRRRPRGSRHGCPTAPAASRRRDRTTWADVMNRAGARRHQAEARHRQARLLKGLPGQ